MSIALLLAIILFLVIIAALWYTPPAPYGLAGKFVGAIAALVLFLVAIGVFHL